MEKMGEERIRGEMEISVFGNWVEISFILKDREWNRNIGFKLKMKHSFWKY